jgi:transcriptional regulator GlxA family with amidase domain
VLSKGIFREDEIRAQIAAVLARSNPDQGVSQQTLQYIHRNFKKPISRTDMADHACVSERHLDRCFQQDMGLTPITYLNRYRLQQAKTLLEDGSHPIAHIAAAVGFSSVTQLGRAFRREYGISPSAYQRGERIDGPVVHKTR